MGLTNFYFFKGGNEYTIYTISNPYNGLVPPNQTQRIPYNPNDDLPPKYEDLVDIKNAYPTNTVILPASTVTSTV